MSTSKVIILPLSRCGNNKKEQTMKKKKTIEEARTWMQFRDQFVATQKLECGYCGRNDLVNSAPLNPTHPNDHVFKRIKGLDPERIATVDHIYPTSKGGEKLNPKNLLVCCSQCNRMKADLTHRQWIALMQRIVKKETKKQSILMRMINKLKGDLNEWIQPRTRENRKIRSNR